MKCFYHKDGDGECAAFWVFLNLAVTQKDDNSNDDFEFIGMDHVKPFPMDMIKPNEQVVIVDYSIKPEQMKELFKITRDVTWIDHHQSVIEDYEDFDEEIRGVRLNGVAACMLTYCYIHKMTDRGLGEIKPFDMSMTESAPMFTKLLADWDVFKFDYGEDTSKFQIAYESYDFNPLSNLWFKFFDDNSFLESMLSDGAIQLRYRNKWVEKYCDSFGYDVIFEGHKCYALNIGNCNSQFFKGVNKNDYDFLIPYAYNGNEYKVSLYGQNGANAFEIAKKYGGGGHAGAAGFTVKELPFKIDEKEE